MHPVEDTRGWLWLSTGWTECKCDARKRWVDVKLLYKPGDRKLRSVGEKMLEWEPYPSRGWAPRPPVEQPRRTGKKGRDSQKSWGVNVLQSLFGLQLTSHTQPFRIKWERYFSKELCPLVLIVSSLCFCMYMCIVGHGYKTLGKVWIPLSTQLWVKQYYYCSSRSMDLALNNPIRLICH